MLKEINVLVDGPFILAQRDLDFPYRGSRNQRLIDVPASLEKVKQWILSYRRDNNAA